MKLLSAIAGGLAGTLAVAGLHEAFKHLTPDAPRVDVLNKDLIRKGLKSMGKKVPDEHSLQQWSVGSELLIDASYYSLTGIGSKKSVWVRGALLGLFAGITAAVLPKPFGLKKEPTNRTPATQLLSVGLYLAGGLAAAAVAQLVENAQADEEEEAWAPVHKEAYASLPASDLVF